MHSSDHMRAYSAYLTHTNTENNHLRLQFKNTERNYDKDSNEILLQWIFLLGNEGHDH